MKTPSTKVKRERFDLEKLEERVGARTVGEVPAEVRSALSQGVIETKNLCEMLAFDYELLFATVLQELGVRSPAKLKREFAVVNELKIMGRLRGVVPLLRSLSPEIPASKVLKHLLEHRSDTVRSWGCLLVAAKEGRALKERFSDLEPFAADPHMGVREIAWMALRPTIMQDLSAAMPILRRWAKDERHTVRRCAIEATRPRGVWCNHFQLLKEQPHHAEPLLELVCADPERYVQNSVANWINDASKSAPQWAQQLCKRWSTESKLPATEYIVRRALRTLQKANKEVEE